MWNHSSRKAGQREPRSRLGGYRKAWKADGRLQMNRLLLSTALTGLLLAVAPTAFAQDRHDDHHGGGGAPHGGGPAPQAAPAPHGPPGGPPGGDHHGGGGPRPGPGGAPPRDFHAGPGA